MQSFLADRRKELEALCRAHDVRSLDVFGSAAGDEGFDAVRSDVDLLVNLSSPPGDMAAFLNLKESLERLLGRRVDLVERQAVEGSRNRLRRRSILSSARPLYRA